MSYDFSIINWKGKGKPIRNKEGDFDCAEIGKANDIRQRLTQAFPEIDFSDPAWGILDCGDDLIEFNIGKSESIRRLMVHTHDPEQAAPLIAELCQQNGWSAYDHQTGQMLEWTTN